MSGWAAAAALAKAVMYAATFGAAGAVFFLSYGARFLLETQRRSVHRTILILIAVAAVTSFARILLLAASMSDTLAGMLDPAFAAMILRAGEGEAILLRVVGLSLCIAALAPGRFWMYVAFIGAVLAAASFAAVGHVHTLKPDRLPVLILMLHLCCGAFWLGGLWPLLRLARGADIFQTAVLAARFGKLALYVVALLVVAGVLLSYRLLGSVAALWSSNYGRLLGFKILLVAAMLCLAALNKLRLTPRLAAGDVVAAAQLRRSIGFEMGVGAFILLVTATFTSLTGPAD